MFRLFDHKVAIATSSPGLFPQKNFLREKPWGRGCEKYRNCEVSDNIKRLANTSIIFNNSSDFMIMSFFI